MKRVRAQKPRPDRDDEADAERQGRLDQDEGAVDEALFRRLSGIN